MNLHIQLLRDPDDVQDTLRDDGWSLERERQGLVLARHPNVRDEQDARSRLCPLGLLTSSGLRIQFDRRRVQAKPAQG